MRGYQKKLLELRYTIKGNNHILDNKDAAEVSRMAFEEGLDLGYLRLSQGNLYRAAEEGRLYERILEILNQLKDGKSKA